MRFEPYVIEDAERLYTEYHDRWRISHGPVITFERNESVAFTLPSRPVQEATVALVTTGGVHLRTQPAYDMENRLGDMTLRFVPHDTPVGDLRFTHDHYDHGAADQDPNCMFPLEHLRAFEAAGIIGRAAPTHVGASGWIPQPRTFLAQAVPAIVERFRDEGVDVALLTGGWPVCLRSVGLLQNALEEKGLPTASVTTMPVITVGCGVPRAGYVRFPLGTPLGEAGQVDVQQAILADLLHLVWEAPGPRTVAQFPYRWRRGLPPGRAPVRPPGSTA